MFTLKWNASSAGVGSVCSVWIKYQIGGRICENPDCNMVPYYLKVIKKHLSPAGMSFDFCVIGKISRFISSSYFFVPEECADVSGTTHALQPDFG
jgi:hypothetical protein